MNNKPLTNTSQLRTDVKNLTLNELCFDEDMLYDQPCYWGLRFGTHAVYCHNQDSGCMKCRGYTKDDCDGYRDNEDMDDRKLEDILGE